MPTWLTNDFTFFALFAIPFIILFCKLMGWGPGGKDDPHRKDWRR